MHYVYILFSARLNRFYIGETSLLPSHRLEQHNSGMYVEKFTAKGIPWQLFLTIECHTLFQALNIERHIKNMKSTKYINNLKLYPEMVEKLKSKYADSPDG